MAEVLYPLFESNRKGFVVTATIQEAERLSDFLNETIKDVGFSAYHSKMTIEERAEVLRRSRESEGRHYIVAVRALDEGVNMPWLSAYIDLM